MHADDADGDVAEDADEDPAVPRLNEDEMAQLRNHKCTANYYGSSASMEAHNFLMLWIKSFEGKWKHPLKDEYLPRFILDDVKMVRCSVTGGAFGDHIGVLVFGCMQRQRAVLAGPLRSPEHLHHVDECEPGLHITAHSDSNNAKQL